MGARDAVMNPQPLLFQGRQWFGAAYLGGMGIQLVRKPITAAGGEPVPRQSSWRPDWPESPCSPSASSWH